MTTGGGKVRFNPNLYSNGYVCLSLLGTWRAGDACSWTPISGISQILMSIQTLVMNIDVYYN
jgi:ubiquitin-protein ligase